MNSRERVLAALNHEVPDRVPIDFGGFPGTTSMNLLAYQKLLEYFGIKRDARMGNLIMFTAEIDEEILNRLHVDTKNATPSISQFGTPEEFVDKAWGVKWHRSMVSADYTYAPAEGPFQKISRPTANDVKNFKWPRPSEIEDFPQWREKSKRLRQESDKALIARAMSGIFTQAQYMRGLEAWMMDLVMNRPFSDALHAKLCDLWIETVGGIIEAVGDNIDIIQFGDDFGLQNQPMLSPSTFREQVKPLMKKMIGTIKPLTKAKIALHTCGSVFAYIDDFMDIGIDILNPLQSNAKDMDPLRIKEKTAGKMALWGGIDTHEVLPKGDNQAVRAEVQKKISIYGKGGGYVLSADHNIQVDIPPQNLVAMFEAAVEYGVY